MRKLAKNRAFDMETDDFLKMYFGLQERTRHSPDAEESEGAYLENANPTGNKDLPKIIFIFTKK